MAIPHPAALYADHRKGQETPLMEQLLKVVPSMYDLSVNRHIIDSTEFRQYHLRAQIECFVQEFMGEVYDLESARSYYVRLDFMICPDRKGSGHGYTKEDRQIIAVPAVRLDARLRAIANHPAGIQTKEAWLLYGTGGRPTNFPGPALLRIGDGCWSQGGYRFLNGWWSATSKTRCVIDAVAAKHPGIENYRSRITCAPGSTHLGNASRKYLAEGIRRVRWQLTEPSMSMVLCPRATRWLLDFDIAISDDAGKEHVETRYFAIDFVRGLQELQDEQAEAMTEEAQRRRDAFESAQSAGRMNEMGRGEESASRRMGRMAAYWPEARQGEQW